MGDLIKTLSRSRKEGAKTLGPDVGKYISHSLGTTSIKSPSLFPLVLLGQEERVPGPGDGVHPSGPMLPRVVDSARQPKGGQTMG